MTSQTNMQEVVQGCVAPSGPKLVRVRASLSPLKRHSAQYIQATGASEAKNRGFEERSDKIP